VTGSTPDPEQPSDPERAQFPQYPAGAEGAQPAADPRPIRANRVWAGIGLALLGYLVLFGLGWLSSVWASQIVGLVVPGELLLWAAVLGWGIVVLARGDRGLGVGLLVGWAAGAVISGGVCVVLIIAVANSYGG
jgi:hypothetical protein